MTLSVLLHWHGWRAIHFPEKFKGDRVAILMYLTKADKKHRLSKVGSPDLPKLPKFLTNQKKFFFFKSTIRVGVEINFNTHYFLTLYVPIGVHVPPRCYFPAGKRRVIKYTYIFGKDLYCSNQTLLMCTAKFSRCIRWTIVFLFSYVLHWRWV